ncbi:MAG: beta-propeller fold lactonase family protein [Gammaproteobacteria bacterium]
MSTAPEEQAHVSCAARALAIAAFAAGTLLAANGAAAEVPFARHFGRYDLGGMVYVMTNASAGNQVVVYLRDRQGRLAPLHNGAVSTGGLGGSANAAIDPLGSQGALTYDDDAQMLFAVNAGDNTVAALDTSGYGFRPALRQVVASGGFIPVSLAVSEDRLYVLNAGGSGSVTTFAIARGAGLRQIGVLDLKLPPAATAIPFDQVGAPNQVGVDALARHLVVTHVGGGEVLTVGLDDSGVPSGSITSTASPGAGPFSFGVTRFGSILVAEAASGSVSAFDPPSGTDPLKATASAVPTGQAATCWIVVHDDGFAYVSNTGSNTLGMYTWTRTGHLQLVAGAAATASGAPTDLTLANGGGFLYSLDAGSGSISGFAISPNNGALRRVETQGGLPASAGLQGIASRDF